MAQRSVCYRKRLEIRGGQGKEILSLDDAVAKIKEMACLRADRSYKNGRKRKGFDQTIELVMHLGIDPRQADQALRGAISLPKGLGKSRTVIAFCEEPLASQAKAAGAIDAGGAALVERIAKEGWTDFDVAVAHPSMMGQVGKLGRVLGPQGKMPSPKAGTVTPDIINAVREFIAGRIEFRNDSGGNVHMPVGKASFDAGAVRENVLAAIQHIQKLKPATAKGVFFKKLSLSATQTPSVLLEVPA